MKEWLVNKEYGALIRLTSNFKLSIFDQFRLIFDLFWSIFVNFGCFLIKTNPITYPHKPQTNTPLKQYLEIFIKVLIYKE